MSESIKPKNLKKDHSLEEDGLLIPFLYIKEELEIDEENSKKELK